MRMIFKGAKHQITDNSGNPLASGTVEFFTPDGAYTTNKDTYSEYTYTSANSNPVVADAGGWVTAYLDGDYDVTITSSDGSFTQNVRSINPELTDSNTVSTLAALKLKNGATKEDLVFMTGYYAEGDGGGGWWYWADSSTDTANDGTIVQATGVTTGRWKRVYDGAINVKWFGAKGDAATDDTTYIQAAIDATAAGGSLYFPPGSYKITSVLTRDASAINIHGDVFGSIIYTTADIAMLSFTGQHYYSSIQRLTFVYAGAGATTANKAIYINNSSTFKYMSFCKFSDLTFQGTYYCFYVDQKDDTTGATGWDWNTVTNCHCISYGSNSVNTFFKANGSGTGCVYNGGSLVFVGYGFDIGDGVSNCGDLTFANYQMGGVSGTGFKLTRGSNYPYGDRISVNGVQFDAGITTGFNLTGIVYITVNNCNYGGAVTNTLSNCGARVFESIPDADGGKACANSQKSWSALVSGTHYNTYCSEFGRVHTAVGAGATVQSFLVEMNSTYTGCYVEHISSSLCQGVGESVRITRFHVYRGATTSTANVIEDSEIGAGGLTHAQTASGNNMRLDITTNAASGSNIIYTYCRVIGGNCTVSIV